MILLVFLLFGCAGHQVTNDPVFDNYKRLFEHYAQQEGRNIAAEIPVMFGEMPNEKVVGFCKRNTNPYIVINKDYWDNTSETSKVVLLLHEFGHCLLNKEHDNRRLGDGCPVSIMHYAVVTRNCFNKYKESYLEEYFQ